MLKPLDLILPYRLEMGTKMINKNGKNLYEFWGEKLKDFILSEIKQDEVIINLASTEYSKALKLNNIENKVITPIFKDYKNGQLKVISFYAKELEERWLILLLVTILLSFNELKLFNYEGYTFSMKLIINWFLLDNFFKIFIF